MPVFDAYPLSTWEMQMIFKFGPSVQAARIYPTATLKQVTNGNMCSFYFYKAGRTRGWGAELVGLKSLFSGDALLSGMIVILSGSSMATAPTCLVLRSMEALGLGKRPCRSLLPSQKGRDQGVGQDSGQWQSHPPVRPEGSPRTPAQWALVGHSSSPSVWLVPQ